MVTDCEAPIRSIVLRNLTLGAKAKWWVLLGKFDTATPADTNDTDSSAEAILEEYPGRQPHENAYRTLKHGHHGDALPKAYRLERIKNQQGEKRQTISTHIEEKDLWFV